MNIDIHVTINNKDGSETQVIQPVNSADSFSLDDIIRFYPNATSFVLSFAVSTNR